MPRLRRITDIKITRTTAAAIIDDVRVALVQSDTAHEAVARIQAILTAGGLPPLRKCTGEAHSNPMIDNCQLCVPRWGVVGPFAVVR